MGERIAEIVSGLTGLTDVNGLWREVDRRLARGDAAFVADLGIALARAHGTAVRPAWQYRSVFQRLVRSLALGTGDVAQAVRLVAEVPTGRDLAGRVASLLAAGRPVADLAVVFAGDGAPGGAVEELRACLVHELVLRGVAVAEVPGIAGWATSPHWRDHPLGWLPLELSEVEGEPLLPSYSVTGTGAAVPFGLPAGRSIPPGEPVPPMAEVAAADAVTEAVDNWVDESNGRIEARVFEPATPLAPDSVPSALAALDLECLDGGDVPRVVACPPAHAWQVLFAAASGGGAYSSGHRGARGRLAAWNSLAGLVGTPVGASAGEVGARVGECAWYGFEADTDWFAGVVWSIGLAVLDPDGRRLAVLAATDTD
ncbi:DUF6183 family protein [Saccharothrix syringae]|uniref:Uncharacterized protein n=1 Tax=Saccharothrix syringae TaxID=103733 RepID=A0A5Q0H5H5_SACSY|nr:DUF6183 family protein [Saccharothrix syringae]QFZ21457.1 hypothetical protein EKG83_32350 [Saccharothrix syringae]